MHIKDLYGTAKIADLIGIRQGPLAQEILSQTSTPPKIFGMETITYPVGG